MATFGDGRSELLSSVLVSCWLPPPPSLSMLAAAAHWLLLACCLDARTQPCHHLSYIGLILLRNAIYHKVICLHCAAAAAAALALACLEGFTAIHHVFAPSEARFNLGPNTPSIRGHRIMDCFVAPLASSLLAETAQTQLKGQHQRHRRRRRRRWPSATDSAADVADVAATAAACSA